MCYFIFLLTNIIIYFFSLYRHTNVYLWFKCFLRLEEQLFYLEKVFHEKWNYFLNQCWVKKKKKIMTLYFLFNKILWLQIWHSVNYSLVSITWSKKSDTYVLWFQLQEKIKRISRRKYFDRILIRYIIVRIKVI